MMQKRRAFRLGVLSSLLALGIVCGFTPAASASSPSPVSFHAWSGPSLLQGQFDSGVMPMFEPQGRLAVSLKPGANIGTWTSPAYHSPAPIGDLVSSWQAKTPVGSWIETHLSVYVAGHWSGWYVMGKWAFENTPALTRTSVDGQSDVDGTIYTDTYVAGDNGKPSDYRLQVVFHSTSAAKPRLYQVAATTSNVGDAPATSATTMDRTVDLMVPRLSQMTHQGEYPAYGGGGRVWCSPTSTAMVVQYWGQGPSAADVASLPPDPVFDANHRADGQVDWAALHTWDATYEGAGNWPFNTAYASTYGLDGSVRQYATLQAVEGWIKRGVPVVASIAWDNRKGADIAKKLDGAALDYSDGHLMVITGFTKSGDVITNDPAAPGNSTVHRTYQRAQFEHNWLQYGAGATYVIKPLYLAG